MDLDPDALLAAVAAHDPGALAAAGGPEAARRLLAATMQALRARLDSPPEAPLAVPGLGVFRPRLPPGKAPPTAAKPGAPPGPPWVFAPEAADHALQAWRKALRAVERPLVHPTQRFVVVFSAKSACSTVVIWFLHTLGLALQARAYSEWPHHYRIDRYYGLPQVQAARESLGPDDVKVLRVVRDPIDRAGSSFRHALGTGYARQSILDTLGIDTDRDGLSLARFIDFLEREDLSRCDPHHRRQKHALERVRRPDRTINASRTDLFEGLNAFERDLGLPVTVFDDLTWVRELQATRVPHSVALPGDPYRMVLTRQQAQRGPWPTGLLTPEARERLARLYAEDIALYSAA